jgi:hypothetical protein
MYLYASFCFILSVSVCICLDLFPHSMFKLHAFLMVVEQRYKFFFLVWICMHLSVPTRLRKFAAQTDKIHADTCRQDTYGYIQIHIDTYQVSVCISVYERVPV